MKTLLVPALVVVALLLAVAGYVASYLALVEPAPNYYTIRTGYSAMLVEDGVDDSYRFAHSYLRWVYWPANQIDRRLRPDTWD
jgi:hypothetical protein